MDTIIAALISLGILGIPVGGGLAVAVVTYRDTQQRIQAGEDIEQFLEPASYTQTAKKNSEQLKQQSSESHNHERLFY